MKRVRVRVKDRPRGAFTRILGCHGPRHMQRLPNSQSTRNAPKFLGECLFSVRETWLANFPIALSALLQVATAQRAAM